jgi:isocitrate dehydrogenase
MIDKAMRKAIANKKVTYDFARIIKNSKEISCSEFGDEIIASM